MRLFFFKRNVYQLGKCKVQPPDLIVSKFLSSFSGKLTLCEVIEILGWPKRLFGCFCKM